MVDILVSAGRAISTAQGPSLSRAARFAAIALLLFVFCTNIYRAVTQAMTHDEALTYQWFLRGGFWSMWMRYNANNHVLHTLLCDISINVFGLSEFSLRLPSVLGGAYFLVIAYRLASELARNAWQFLLAIGLLALNPFLLDYLSVARGYGLGCALLLHALLLATRVEPLCMSLPQLRWLGLLAGLAITANLTMLFPLAALCVTILLWRWWDSKSILSLRGPLLHSVGTAAVVIFAFHIVPFIYAYQKVLAKKAAAAAAAAASATQHADILKSTAHQAFYAGAPSLRVGLESLVRNSFFHSDPNAGYSMQEPMSGIPAVLTTALILTVILCVVHGAILMWGYMKKSEALDVGSRFLVVVSSVVTVMTFGVLVAHWLLKFPYPELRTGLYWIPVCTLLAIASWAKAPSRTARAVLYFGASAVVASYAAQYQTTYYSEWRYAAAARELIKTIVTLESAESPQAVPVYATWLLEPSFNFYRDMYRLDWIPEVQRVSPTEARAKYYALLNEERALVGERKLKTLSDEKVSGAILARSREE